MRKNVFIFVILLFLAVLCPGCTMMPSDEEIINGSVLENEIFGDGLIDDGLDEGEILLDDEEILADDGEENENLQNEDYDEENLDGNVVVDVQ